MPIIKDKYTKFSYKIIAIITALFLMLIILNLWFYHTQKQTIWRIEADKLSSIGKLKASQIIDWRNERLGDAEILTESPFFAGGVKNFIASNSKEHANHIRTRLRSLVNHFGYTEALLVNTNGQILLSLTNKLSVNDTHKYTLQLALQTRTPIISELYLEPKNSIPYLSIIAPIFIDQTPTAPTLGAVILIINVNKFLFPLIQSWPMPSQTAETLLVKRDGNDVLFLNDLRHKSNTALKFRIPQNYHIKIPALMAVLGNTGIFEGLDYRGVNVLSDIRAIPNSSWFIISKQDTAEIFSIWNLNILLFILLFIFMGCLSIFFSLFVWQKQRQRYYERLYLDECELRNITQRHSVILQSIGDAVIATDAEGRVELLNSIAEVLTGWTNTQAHGKPLEEIFHIINEETHIKVENPVAKVLSTGNIVGLANHTVLIAKDGTERPIMDSAAPIYDEQGKIAGVVLVFSDQTEQYESAAKYHALIQSANDAIITADDAGHIVGWNRSAETLFNYTEHEILHEPLTKIIPESLKFQHTLGMNRLKNGAKPHILGKTIEVIGLRKNATQFPIELSLAQWKVSNTIFFSGIIRDLTERKADEAARNKLQEELIQAQKMESIGRLAGGVAHDFNNVLGVILGNAELALNKIAIDNPLRIKLERIRAAVLQSAGITKQLLSFARRQPSSPQIVNLNESLQEMLHMLEQLIGEDISLLWQPSENLWPVKIDPTQLNQLLANLCVNARDAIDGVGKIIIETSKVTISVSESIKHPNLVPGEFVLLSVTDNGCGMDAATQLRIFEPFFTTKPTGKGTGLGLSTVFGIVKQHGGFIDVESYLGKGTVFRIYFPRCIEPVQHLSSNEEIVSLMKQDATVLLVEDDVNLLDLVKTMLEENGYQVLIANSPVAAIQLAQTCKIDLLVTDIVMPEMSGLELAAQLTATFSQLKVLFMSGYTDEVTAQRYVLDEKANLIRKPFTNVDFIRKVRGVLHDT